MPVTNEAIDDSARLRRALDNAIYTLEDIKHRASRGASSEVAGWYCEEIRELAATALARLDASHHASSSTNE